MSQHDVFEALADPTRRHLVELLVAGEQSVSALCVPFSISRTAVSKHLQVLADAGVIGARPVGRETRYHLQPAALRAVGAWVERVAGAIHNQTVAQDRSPARAWSPEVD